MSTATLKLIIAILTPIFGAVIWVQEARNNAEEAEHKAEIAEARALTVTQLSNFKNETLYLIDGKLRDYSNVFTVEEVAQLVAEKTKGDISTMKYYMQREFAKSRKEHKEDMERIEQSNLEVHNFEDSNQNKFIHVLEMRGDSIKVIKEYKVNRWDFEN